MKENKQIDILKFIMGTDMDFYEHFLARLSEEELQRFLDNNPDFLMQQ